MSRSLLKLLVILIAAAVILIGAAGCASQSSEAGGVRTGNDMETGLAVLELPPIQSASLGTDGLQVVATTSIVGDIVAQVGGDFIDLKTLMTPGQDPHSFKLSPKDLSSLVEAKAIFINGWNLEEGLVDDLANAAKEAIIVPVSAGITPLPAGQDSHADGHEVEANDYSLDNANPDPHTWLDPHLVVKWVENVLSVLSSLDPGQAKEFQANADAYLEVLQELIDYFDAQVASLPSDRRRLVTSHGSMVYFAAAYDFDIVGTVIPAASTLAEPSSGELAKLIETMEGEGVCTIFTELTANDQLARTAARELDSCDEVKVIRLYTGALGPAGSGAGDYLSMMRWNIDAIIEGLKE